MSGDSGGAGRPIHIPVMPEEVLAGLAPKNGCRYLDGTLGLGGHAEAILAAAPECALCGLDRDSQALELARERLAPFADRAHLFNLPFARFDEALQSLEWREINGALLDLGLSSLQLDTPERGFSFRGDGPLDMRMDQALGDKKASDLVNRASYDQLREWIAAFGEDPQAGRIARHIIEARRKRPIQTTHELADIIWAAYPAAWRRSARRHPATRVFQALRMAVNDEPGQLRQFLAQIWNWLAPGARFVVISFHSIEDRMVKQAMRQWAKNGQENCGGMLLHKKPLTPGEDEMAVNPRASSAKLRVIEKSGLCNDIA